MKLLARVPQGSYDDVFRVLESLPKTGSLAPDTQSYTLAINALISSVKASQTSNEGLAEVSSKLNELWTGMKNDLQRGRTRIDARCFTSVMELWRLLDHKSPKSVDRQAVLHDISLLTGLGKGKTDDEKGAKVTRSLVTLDASAFFNALVLARLFSNKNQKLVYQYFESVRLGDVPVADATITHRHAVLAMRSNPEAAEELLVWLLRQSSVACRPEVSTIEAAMQCSSYAGCLRILAHCTGKNEELLVDGERRLLEQREVAAEKSEDKPPQALSRRMLKGAHTKAVAPTLAMLDALFQKAIETRDRRRLDRSITIAEKLGFLDLEDPQKLDASRTSTSFRTNLYQVADKLKSHPSVPQNRQAQFSKICDFLRSNGVASPPARSSLCKTSSNNQR